VLNTEIDQHLVGESGNNRNGYGSKAALTETGRMELGGPRARQASFHSQLIAKHQRRFTDFLNVLSTERGL
jgi:transposase-like protein